MKCDRSRVVGFSQNILEWSDHSGRDFPWRDDADDYQVLVSEVLLRRSRSSTVAKVAQELFALWPNVCELSDAHVDEVRSVIEPLGLVRRADQLVDMAHQLCELGEVPSDLDALLALPGVGRYTARATLGLPVVDGTSARVYRRYFGLLDVDAHKEVDGELWALVDSVVPPELATEVNWAVLDLAAAVCLPRSPDCDRCPLLDGCVYGQDHVGELSA